MNSDTSCIVLFLVGGSMDLRPLKDGLVLMSSVSATTWDTT